MQPISRTAAKQAGLTRYFTGAPCKHGHVCERMISTRGCVLCLRAASKKAYAERPDEFRAKSRARMNALYQYDPERFRARSRGNYAANPDAWKARIRAYVAAHPAWERARQSLKKRPHLPGKFTADDLIAKVDAHRGRCVCGADLTIAWQIDHIVPACRGGTNWPDNIQILCPACNKDKGIKTMAEWRGAA